MKKELNIVDLLQEGEENSQTASCIAKKLNRATRSVTAEIHRQRAEGKIILSTNTGGYNGFYLPANDKEIEKFVRCMYSRMKNIKIATLSAEKYLKEVCQNGKE